MSKKNKVTNLRFAKQREKSIDLVILQPNIQDIAHKRILDGTDYPDLSKEVFNSNAHGARALLDSIDYVFDLESFDTVIIFSNRLFKHLKSALKSSYPDDSAFFESSSKDRDAVLLRQCEIIDKKFAVATKAFQQAINIRNTGRVLVICEVVQCETTPASVIQAIGRFRDVENADITAAIFRVISDRTMFYPMELKGRLESYFFDAAGDKELLIDDDLRVQIKNVENYCAKGKSVKEAIELVYNIEKQVISESIAVRTFVDGLKRRASYLKPMSLFEYLTKRYKEEYSSVSLKDITDALTNPFTMEEVYDKSGELVDFYIDYTDRFKELFISKAMDFTIKPEEEEFKIGPLVDYCSSLQFKGWDGRSEEIVNAIKEVLEKPELYKEQGRAIRETIYAMRRLQFKFTQCSDPVEGDNPSSKQLAEFHSFIKGFIDPYINRLHICNPDIRYSNSSLRVNIRKILEIAKSSSSLIEFNRNEIGSEYSLANNRRNREARRYSEREEYLRLFEGDISINSRTSLVDIGASFYAAIENRCGKISKLIDKFNKWLDNMDVAAFKRYGKKNIEKLCSYASYLSGINSILHISGSDRPNRLKGIRSKLFRDLNGECYNLTFIPLILLKDRKVDPLRYMPNCLDHLVERGEERGSRIVDLNVIKTWLFEKPLWKINSVVSTRFSELMIKGCTVTVRRLDGSEYTGRRELLCRCQRLAYLNEQGERIKRIRQEDLDMCRQLIEDGQLYNPMIKQILDYSPSYELEEEQLFKSHLLNDIRLLQSEEDRLKRADSFLERVKYSEDFVVKRT